MFQRSDRAAFLAFMALVQRAGAKAFRQRVGAMENGMPTGEMKENDAIQLIEDFVREKTTIEEFSTEYQRWWKRARDTNSLACLNPYLQRALDVVFTSVERADEGSIDGLSAETVCRLEVRVALSIVSGIG